MSSRRYLPSGPFRPSAPPIITTTSPSATTNPVTSTPSLLQPNANRTFQSTTTAVSSSPSTSFSIPVLSFASSLSAAPAPAPAPGPAHQQPKHPPSCPPLSSSSSSSSSVVYNDSKTCTFAQRGSLSGRGIDVDSQVRALLSTMPPQEEYEELLNESVVEADYVHFGLAANGGPSSNSSGSGSGCPSGWKCLVQYHLSKRRGGRGRVSESGGEGRGGGGGESGGQGAGVGRSGSEEGEQGHGQEQRQPNPQQRQMQLQGQKGSNRNRNQTGSQTRTRNRRGSQSRRRNRRRPRDPRGTTTTTTTTTTHAASSSSSSSSSSSASSSSRRRQSRIRPRRSSSPVAGKGVAGGDLNPDDADHDGDGGAHGDEEEETTTRRTRSRTRSNSVWVSRSRPTSSSSRRGQSQGQSQGQSRGRSQARARGRSGSTHTADEENRRRPAAEVISEKEEGDPSAPAQQKQGGRGVGVGVVGHHEVFGDEAPFLGSCSVVKMPRRDILCIFGGTDLRKKEATNAVWLYHLKSSRFERVSFGSMGNQSMLRSKKKLLSSSGSNKSHSSLVKSFSPTQTSPIGASTRQFSEVFEYPSSHIMSLRPSLRCVEPCSRLGHCAVALDSSEMLVFGGNDLANQRLLNDLWVLSLEPSAERRWSLIVPEQAHASSSGWMNPPQARAPALPLPRWYASACKYQKDHVFFFGGETSHFRLLDDVCVFSRQRRSWLNLRTVFPLPPARMLHDATAINGKMYVVGGLGTKSGTETCDVWSFDMLAMKWQKLQNASGSVGPFVSGGCSAPGPVAPLYGHAVAGWGNKLVLFGGKRLNRPIDDVWVLDLRSESWHRLQPDIPQGMTPGARWKHACAEETTIRNRFEGLSTAERSEVQEMHAFSEKYGILPFLSQSHITERKTRFYVYGGIQELDVKASRGELSTDLWELTMTIRQKENDLW